MILGRRHERGVVTRTTLPFAEELPRLLAERNMRTSALAAALGLNRSHLSKITRRYGGKKPSVELCIRVARELGLADDYFAEVREEAVVEHVRANGALRDRIYDSLQR